MYIMYHHHRLELPRTRRLGEARWELQGQLVAIHPARDLILCYTAPGELVLDQMMGSGTTLVDADYVALEIRTYAGDARSLDLIGNETIDLIATHPPYASILPYSHDCEGDLSSVHNIAEFADEMRKVAVECMRVLKPGKHCAILMGDSRRNKHFIPITPRVLMSFLEAGFILREDIIKLQWKMKSTREKWFGKNFDFYLIGHEHLYVFRKPDAQEKTTKFKESMKWW